jgi:pimeloyl-ACP methyl ester carboxylesterase
MKAMVGTQTVQAGADQDKIAEAAARIPRADLVTIPAGHLGHTERPAEFTDAVLTWLVG